MCAITKVRSDGFGRHSARAKRAIRISIFGVLDHRHLSGSTSDLADYELSAWELKATGRNVESPSIWKQPARLASFAFSGCAVKAAAGLLVIALIVNFNFALKS